MPTLVALGQHACLEQPLFIARSELPKWFPRRVDSGLITLNAAFMSRQIRSLKETAHASVEQIIPFDGWLCLPYRELGQRLLCEFRHGWLWVTYGLQKTPA